VSRSSFRKRPLTQTEHYRAHALLRVMRYCASELGDLVAECMAIKHADALRNACGLFARLLGPIQVQLDNLAYATEVGPEPSLHYSLELSCSADPQGLARAIESAIAACASSVAGEGHLLDHARGGRPHIGRQQLAKRAIEEVVGK